MRLASVSLLLALLTIPAAAADTIADQAQRAYGVFAGGLSQQDFLTARHGVETFKDVTGAWVQLNGPQPSTGVETYGADTEKFCKGSAVFTLASSDPLTLTLSAKPVSTEFSQTYTLVAGATFAERIEPNAYFAAIGLGPDKIGAQFDQQRALALSQANGIVQIYRPSADILVVTRDRGYPTILARCPKQ